jgi:uncharacterized membrane protein YgcG
MRIARRSVATLIIIAVVLALAAAIAVVVDLLGRDRAFTITAFDREVDVATDGVLSVTETIEVTFHEQRRGIFRDLPRNGPRGVGTVGYRDVRVDQGSDGAPWNFVVESAENGDTRIRIGDAAVWLTPGDYTYRLRYDIEGLTFRSSRDRDRVQVRIDVPGYDWPTDVEQTRLTVRSPAEVVDVACVAGPRRTIRACDPAPSVDGSVVTADFDAFGPGRAATVAIDLDASAFGADLPTFREQPLDRRPGILPVVSLPPALAGLLAALVLALPFLVLEGVHAVQVYRDEVTDPHLHDREHPTAIFGPPRDLRPVEVAGLLLRRKGESLLLGTLVDLDQRGTVTTHSSEAGKKTVLTVEAGPKGVEATPGDAEFLRTLLPGRASVRFDGEYDPDTAQRTQSATNELIRQADQVFADNGLEHGRAPLLRSLWFKALLALGMLLVTVVLALTVARVLALPVGVVAAIAALVVGAAALGRVIWRHERLPLNSEGRDTVAQAEAFREFLRTVESEQLEWAADQPVISHHHPAVSLLPYAIVLGLADSWYGRFGSLIRELALAGAAGGAAAGAVWWTSRSSFDGVAASRSGTMTDPSSSGGGSFGGGGGGSGGGGGGGGSW